MRTFSSMDDIYEYIGETYASDEAQKILLSEAKRLKQCIQNRLDEYYIKTATSGIYERTNETKNSLKIDRDIKVSVGGDSLVISLYFGSGAYGNSLFSNSVINKALSINYGWKVKKNVWFKDIEHFGYYDGYGFIEQGIDDFNSTNKYGIEVIVNPSELPRS